MKEKIKDIAIRALKTFWQATLASIVVAVPEIAKLIPSGWSALKPVLLSAVVGAVAGGFSAMYNGVIAPLLNKTESTSKE